MSSETRERLPFFLGTRVARRILGLFVLSALVPLAALSVVSWFAVTGELQRQTDENLRQLARNAGQSMLQQLLLLENGLMNVHPSLPAAEERGTSLRVTFPSLVSLAVDDGRDRTILSGDVEVLAVNPELDRIVGQRAGSLVMPGLRPGRIVLAVPDTLSEGSRTRLWGEILADSVWAPAETFASLPWVESFCVLIGGGEQDHCSDGDMEPADAFRALGSSDRLATFEYGTGRNRRTAGYWTFHVASAFETEPWTVLVSASRSTIYAPLTGFSLWFVPVVALGFGVVLLLSNIQVRRTMQPLVDLEQGTSRVQAGDFDSRVPVDTDDEFGALARSFNAMSERLGDQLARLEAGREIDRAVLNGFDSEQVASAVIAQVTELIGARSVAVLLDAGESGRPGRLVWPLGDGALGGTDFSLAEQQRARFLEDAHHLDLAEVPALESVARRGLGGGRLTGFPLIAKDRLLGALVVETEGNVPVGDRNIRNARELANQAAIAFDDARLVAELEDMSWGALRALARAIDAKSRWTAGHSERVTEMALALAREMGLSERECDLLHRGGLLHDVGKIGVPAEVLDKAGPLSDEDFAHIRRHPEIGGRILEPIRAFAPALPIVVQHHERWDGEGYPAGLVGEEIDLLARVLAVADTYDAMASARPYRGAAGVAEVTNEVVACAGTQFDPVVVAAFERLMAGRTTLIPQGTEAQHG